MEILNNIQYGFDKNHTICCDEILFCDSSVRKRKYDKSKSHHEVIFNGF